MGDDSVDCAIDVGLGLLPCGIVLLHLQRSGASDYQQIGGAAETFDGVGGVIAVVPFWVVTDELGGHVSPYAVAAWDLDGKAGERSKSVGEVRVGFAPDEALHAAHGGSQDEAQMVDVESINQHGVLRGDHVVVVIVRKVHAQAVGGFAGFAVPDVVGKAD